MILHFYAECALEKRTHPCEGGGEGDVKKKMHKVRFFVGDGGEDLVWRGGKELLLLNESDAGVQQEKICRHNDERCEQSDLRLF